MMEFRQLKSHESLPMDLLLEADPSEELVRAYCVSGWCVVAELEDTTMGIYVLLPLSETTVEIKNIAVVESLRGHGHGRQLLQHALAESARHGFKHVEIGTGNSSLGQLAFYQKCGFRIHAIDTDFFKKNYPEPIFENGIECRDMVRLRYKVSE